MRTPLLVILLLHAITGMGQTKDSSTNKLIDSTSDRQFKTLSAVVVSSINPARIKDDTVSFRVDNDKLLPGATLEDALKRIPGIELRKDGKIKAMGETVQKLYVDGKEFFGNDPAVAMKNLPADMVEQVQVFDDMSEQAKFTRIDDGSRSKTLNIKLKKDKNKGDFGRASIGAGTAKRYDAQASWNHFTSAQKISLVANAGNLNKQAYNFGNTTANDGSAQFSNGMGGNSNANARRPANNGINESGSAGINYTDLWGKRLDIRSSYQFSDNENIRDQEIFRRYSFPLDSSSGVNSLTGSNNRNNNHRLTARLEYSIDSFHSILYTANLSLQNSSLHSQDTSYTLANGKIPYLAVAAWSLKDENRRALNYGGELIYRQRFRLAGRTLTAGWKNGYSDQHAVNDFRNTISTYNSSGANLEFFDPNQRNFKFTNGYNNTFSASYTEPAGKNKFVELNYAHSLNKSVSDKKAYGYSVSTGIYDQADLYQFNNLEYENESNKIGTNFRMIKKKFNYQVGAALQWTDSKNRNIAGMTGKDTVITQKISNLFPTASFSYNISRTSNIRFYYRGRNNMPTVNQLSEVSDLTNPLLIRSGNPALKQEYISNFNLNYSSFHTRSLLFFNAGLSINSSSNKIVNSIDSTAYAVITVKPVNMKNASSGSVNINFGGPVKKLKGVNFNFTTMGFYSKDPNMVYQVKNFTRIFVLDQNIALTYNDKNLELGFSSAVIYNTAKYDLQPGSDVSWIRTGCSADIRYGFKNNFFIYTKIDKSKQQSSKNEFEGDFFTWDLAVAKKFLNNSTEIKLSAYDLLGQDKAISSFAGDNFYEESRGKVMQRFFMLSFSYNFTKSGKKSKANSQEPASPMQIFQ